MPKVQEEFDYRVEPLVRAFDPAKMLFNAICSFYRATQAALANAHETGRRTDDGLRTEESAMYRALTEAGTEDCSDAND